MISKIDNIVTMNTNNSTLFFFGAGAELDFLRGDQEDNNQFVTEVIQHKKYEETLKRLYGKEHVASYILHHNARKVYHDAYENCKKESCPEVIKNKFEYLKTLEIKPKKSNEELIEISNIYRNWFDLLSGEHEITNEEEQMTQKFFSKNFCYFSSLDGAFNTIRNFENKSYGFWKVVNTYTISFLYLFTKLYHTPLAKITRFEDIFNIIINNKQHIHRWPFEYYQTLLRYSMDRKVKVKVATTNYTDIVSDIFGGNLDSSYLSGKLKWFEDYTTLRVYDVEDKNDYETLLKNVSHIFPFLFIRSGVKPIVCTKQVEEYYKFVSMLNDSKTLCVLGYGFSSDDNHINSIIGEWQTKPEKKIVYFYYVDETKGELSEVDDKLRQKCREVLRQHWLIVSEDKLDFRLIFKDSNPASAFESFLMEI